MEGAIHNKTKELSNFYFSCIQGPFAKIVEIHIDLGQKKCCKLKRNSKGYCDSFHEIPGISTSFNQ